MYDIDEKYLTDVITFGEAYMHGLWKTDDLEETLYQMMRDRSIHKMLSRRIKTDRNKLMEMHYDLGNDLFRMITGPSLCYTSGRWHPGYTLENAIAYKFENILEKLEIKPGMSVLDIGCGWGAFAKHCYDTGLRLNITGVTLSKEGAKSAGKYCDVRVCDYREMYGKFDRVISLGMVEHIGYKQYRDYFETAHRCLADDGIHLLEVTGHNASHKMFNPWINKYIAPEGMLPSLAQLARASERLFVTEDVENYALHYVPTLRAWVRNIYNGAHNFPQYDASFWRMWEFYLLGSAAALRSRDFQHYQMIQTKGRLNPPKRV